MTTKTPSDTPKDQSPSRDPAQSLPDPKSPDPSIPPLIGGEEHIRGK